MLAAFNGSTNVNVNAGLNANGNVVFTDKNGNGSIYVTDTSTTLGAVSEEATGASNTVYLSDGTGAGSSPITVSIGTLSAASVGFATGTPVDLTVPTEQQRPVPDRSFCRYLCHLQCCR